MSDVSILVAAFNAEATLNATLESVANQTYNDWEVIVVDDGSTDSTATIASAWCDRDPRMKLVKGPNRGVASARNEAARYAKAPWLLFLDADDLIAANYLTLMLEEASHDRPCDIIYCAGARVSLDGRIGAPEIPPRDQHFRHLASCCPFFIHACLIRRTVFEEHHGFDATLETCEDWDLWQRMARSGSTFASVDHCLAYYRMRPGSLTRNAPVVFNCIRQVVLRGHTQDLRVKNPLPTFKDGIEPAHARRAIFENAVWCVATWIGNGKNPSIFFNGFDHEFFAHVDIGIDDIVSRMQSGVPIGACMLQNDWAILWSRFKNEIYEAFMCLEKYSLIGGLAAQCMTELERRVLIIPQQTEVHKTVKLDDIFPWHRGTLSNFPLHAIKSNPGPKVSCVQADPAPPSTKSADEFLQNLKDPGRRRIMVVAAHPDDEIIGAGGHFRFWPHVSVAYITNGSPKNKKLASSSTVEIYAETRRKEAENALAVVGVPADRIIALGIDDQDSSFSLIKVTEHLRTLFTSEQPDIVVTHAYEGGHPDHDATCFAVHAACRLAALENKPAPALVEMSSYFGRDGIRIMSTFIQRHIPCVKMVLDKDSLDAKRRMIDHHLSQRYMLGMFPISVECFRPAPTYDFKAPPHSGRLFFEYHDLGIDGYQWRELAQLASVKLGLSNL